MKNLQAIATGLFFSLILGSAQAQSKLGWTDHKCNKDPFTSQVSCSMVVLESLPTKSGGVPGALFTWAISKGDSHVLLLLSLSTLDEPKMSKERDNEKALAPILVRVDDKPIHTIKPTDITLSIKQAPPYRQMFEISDDLLEQLAKGEKVFLRFESSDGSTTTKEFPLKNTADKLYAMMSQFMEMRPQREQVIMPIKREKLIAIARENGATEPSKNLWVISTDDLEKFSQAVIEEHQNQLPAWLQVTGYLFAITGFIFWLVYLGNHVFKI